MKQIIPLGIRDRLRPGWQKLAKRTARLKESWSPQPEWKTLRGRLQESLSPHDLYDLGQAEFCVLQIESEIAGVLEYVGSTSPKVIGEIGLKHSGNSFLFLQTFKSVSRYIGLDLKLENTSKLRYVVDRSVQMDFLEGNSYAEETVTKVDKLLGGSQFDFLFIDGDHEYDGVLADFLCYYHAVRPGGLIALHDIVPDEEVKTGKRSDGSLQWGGGVHLVWQHLKEHFEHREFVESWDQFGFGIGVLTKPVDGPLADGLPEDLVESFRTPPAQG